MSVRGLRVAGFLAVCFLTLTARAESKHTIVFLSDVHLGLGLDDPKEDFRTPEMVVPFLEALSATYGDAIDLVILGDLLELWQPPKHVRCAKRPANLGCTAEQMRQIAADVAKAHSAELRAFGSFAKRGENVLHVAPGNHDSALLLDVVWNEVFPKFEAPVDRVKRVKSGVWVSSDGKVAGEHGHQIAPDANRYAEWPSITKRGRMIRPWGEQFVQQLFNAEEDEYPLVDNITGSGGALMRMNEVGIGGTAKDIGRFVRFFLFQNSIAQRIALLAPPPPSEIEEPPSRWNIRHARKKKHQLILAAIPPDHPLRRLLTDEAKKSLDALVTKEMSDEEIAALCASIVVSKGQSHPCEEPTLGHLLRSAHLIPKSYVMRRHLAALKKEHDAPSLAIFVYGHTHVLEEPWSLGVDGSFVKIANTGAFHRLSDEETFLDTAKAAKLPPGVALRKLPFDFMPPCHTVVVVKYDEADGLYRPQVKQWSAGKLDDACAGPCARVSGCPKPDPAEGDATLR